MDLFQIVAEGAMRAMADIAKEKAIALDTNKAVEALKAETKAGWVDMQEHLRDAVEARMGEAIYREILNVNCFMFATRALKRCGYLPN